MRMTPGEHMLAERLEQKLDADYLLWYDVPAGPRRSQPDFIVLHPRRGLLMLEVRDWSLKALHRMDQKNWQLLSNRMLTTRPNPAGQARQYAQEVADALRRDPQLLEPGGKQPAQLCFAWSYGVVFPSLTRQEFNHAQLARFIEPQRVLCSDEMLETVEARELQSRLWDMFAFMTGGLMSPAQRERVRWILFPELRLPPGAQLDDPDDHAALPEQMPVMDLQQERLARSRGDGQRDIPAMSPRPARAA